MPFPLDRCLLVSNMAAARDWWVKNALGQHCTFNSERYQRFFSIAMSIKAVQPEVSCTCVSNALKLNMLRRKLFLAACFGNDILNYRMLTHFPAKPYHFMVIPKQYLRLMSNWLI